MLWIVMECNGKALAVGCMWTTNPHKSKIHWWKRESIDHKQGMILFAHWIMHYLGEVLVFYILYYSDHHANPSQPEGSSFRPQSVNSKKSKFHQRAQLIQSHQLGPTRGQGIESSSHEVRSTWIAHLHDAALSLVRTFMFCQLWWKSSGALGLSFRPLSEWLLNVEDSWYAACVSPSE